MNLPRVLQALLFIHREEKPLTPQQEVEALRLRVAHIGSTVLPRRLTERAREGMPLYAPADFDLGALSTEAAALAIKSPELSLHFRRYAGAPFYTYGWSSWPSLEATGAMILHMDADNPKAPLRCSLTLTPRRRANPVCLQSGDSFRLSKAAKQDPTDVLEAQQRVAAGRRRDQLAERLARQVAPRLPAHDVLLARYEGGASGSPKRTEGLLQRDEDLNFIEGDPHFGESLVGKVNQRIAQARNAGPRVTGVDFSWNREAGSGALYRNGNYSISLRLE